MKYEKRWKTIKRIGAGGQGQVFRVLDRASYEVNAVVLWDAIKHIVSNPDTRDLSEMTEVCEKMQSNFNIYAESQKGVNHKALKILHSPDEARNFDDAEKRLTREIDAMASVSHPSLLKIEDVDLDEKWFVSKFYPNGTLESKSEWFTGQVERTLKAIRPIVDGVATLHEANIVHRDIKPENIFVDENNRLVLGDFGLVYFTDSDHTRLSGTIENVGSYDWMPLWAARRRIEEIKPTFDVFSLGKTIWSMVSQKPSLHLWYLHDEEYDLQNMFPNDPAIVFLNRILDKCIVEREENCLPDARALCAYIDNALRALNLGADPIGDFQRPCRVCGFGVYKQITDIEESSHSSIENFGLVPRGGAAFSIFSCGYCGHVQLFYNNKKSYPPAWKEN